MNDDDVVYKVWKNMEGKVKCGVQFVLGPNGEIPFEVPEEIRRVLDLEPDEEPVYVPHGKNSVVVKKD